MSSDTKCVHCDECEKKSNSICSACYDGLTEDPYKEFLEVMKAINDKMRDLILENKELKEKLDKNE